MIGKSSTRILSAAVLSATLLFHGASMAQSTNEVSSSATEEQTMLVLDASGSMWGKIEGKTKIEIAREAVAGMVAQWPQGRRLGLMAYGHRSKGNCADIELLKIPTELDKDSFVQSVNALQPKGMTPISAAVRMAAEQLKFSEKKATVILVSDGEETCNADPCALGEELEKLGVDFTAHVVGFDINKNAKAKAQLQCLAKNTGGRYLDARNAGELVSALKTVTQPAPAAAPPACGKFVEGPEFAINMSTWPTGEHASQTAVSKTFDGVEMEVDADPRACQKLCSDDAACTAWMFEAIGSNFRTKPMCFRWDGVAALGQPEQSHPGNAVGIKPGVRQIVRASGAACD